MALGFDFSYGRPGPAAIKAAGGTWVGRYVCQINPQTKGKVITGAEAQGYLAAGLDIVIFHEWYANRVAEGAAAGRADAAVHDIQTSGAGLAGAVMYASIDYDAPQSDQPAINDYFRAVADSIGFDRTAVYGGFWPVSRLLDAGLVSYTAGTLAWSGTNWETASWKPNIMQGGFVNIAGVQCDRDIAWTDDFGQFPRPAQPTSPTATGEIMNGYLDGADASGAAQPTYLALPKTDGKARLAFFTGASGVSVRVDWVNQPAGPGTADIAPLGYTAGRQGVAVPAGTLAAVVRRTGGDPNARVAWVLDL